MVRSGPVDRPGPRASHVLPTPTSGGLAIVAGAAAGLLACSLAARGVETEAGSLLDLRTLQSRHGPQTLWTAAWAVAFGLLGALDDLHDLSARLKLGVMAAGALGYALLVVPIPAIQLGALVGARGDLGVVAGLLGVAAGLLIAVNAVNFMDGSNGLVIGSMAVAFAALGAGLTMVERPTAAALAFAAAAASCGLLPWNLGGRVFQGDVGALFTGWLFAGLCATGSAGLGWLFGPTVLAPLLVDVLLTLLRRARAGRPLMSAHREHLYQRWLRATERSHAALAVRVWALTAASSLLALAAAGARPGRQADGFGGVQLAAFAGLSLALAAGWAVVSRRVDARLAELRPCG